MSPINPYPDIPVVSTVPQVAEILDCSERHVRNLIARGDLGHVYLGRLVKVPRHSLLELLGANGNAGPTNGTDVTTNTTPNVQEGDGRGPP